MILVCCRFYEPKQIKWYYSYNVEKLFLIVNYSIIQCIRFLIKNKSMNLYNNIWIFRMTVTSYLIHFCPFHNVCCCFYNLMRIAEVFFSSNRASASFSEFCHHFERCFTAIYRMKGLRARWDHVFNIRNISCKILVSVAVLYQYFISHSLIYHK